VFLLALIILVGCGGGGSGSGAAASPVMGKANPGNPRDNTPQVRATSQPGTAVVDNAKATLDYSNANDGYISVKSKLGTTKVKVLVDVGGVRYQYTITSSDNYIIIPMSKGSGTYTVGVWENITGDQYAAIFSQDIQVNLTDEFSPFLYPNQYVNFSTGDAATNLSQELTQGATSDVEAINGVYHWVVVNITYDENKARQAADGSLAGYLPNNTDTINSGTGICFDYAVLTASMLRAQRIPAKLVIGYAGTAYHAWMEVYSQDAGKVLSYTFDGNKWVRMDPTFDAASKGKTDLSSIIGDGSHYQDMFYY